ncbi:MAG: MlaD family protein, partial [Candidatus Pacebacteria bacterium]|nr:MlaD family protein [Candidatus Paceibacterota bacterium]
MLVQAQKYKVGVFVIAAVAILFLVLIALTGRQLGTKEYPAYTTFQESVQGLEVGAAVKLRGVPIGNVKDIQIQANKLHVRVDIKIYEDSIRTQNKMTIPDFLRQQIEKGARCRLEFAGITGLKYIEIDFFETTQNHRAMSTRQQAGKEGLYIPSTRSLLSGMTTDLSYTLGKLAQVDFEGISKDISRLVAAANDYLDDERLDAILTHFQTSSEQLVNITDELQGQLGDNALKNALTEMEKAFSTIDSAAEELGTELKRARLADLSTKAADVLDEYRTVPDTLETAAKEATSAAEQLQDFTASARETLEKAKLAETGEQTRRSLAEVRLMLGETLRSIDQTLASLKKLADVIEQQPEALLRGKRQPKVRMGKE